jgi:hypothetical protein
MKLNSLQLSTVLVALRIYQQELDGGYRLTGNLRDIATNDGAHNPMDATGLDGLCEALNGDCMPRVVIVMDGGLVQEVIADQPLEVTVIDYDAEGSDPEDLRKVPQGNGDEDDLAAIREAECLVDASLIARLLSKRSVQLTAADFN